jgi:hypothetical protein
MSRILARVVAGSSLVAASLMLSAAPATQVALRPALARVLETNLQFTAADLDALRAGSVVTSGVSTDDLKEVAVAAATHANVSADYWAVRMGNAGQTAPGHTDVGRFSKPAVANDLAAWRLAPEDLSALSSCSADDCDFRLSADVLSKVRASAGGAPSSNEDAWTRGVREGIAGYVAAYQTNGAAGLPALAGKPPIQSGATLKTLRARFTFLNDSRSDLLQFLDRYPAIKSDHATEIYHWSRDTVLMTSVLSVVHLVTWRAPGPLADILLVSEQIYTSREVDSLVEVSLLSPDTTPDKPGVTVVNVSRSISSSLDGRLRVARRATARSQARSAIGEYLTNLRTAFERDSRTPR